MYPRYHLASDISHGMSLDGTDVSGFADEYRFTVTGEPGMTYSLAV